MSVDVQAFQGDRRVARRLWQFDCDLYRSDPNWIAPFRKMYLQHFSADRRLYDDPRDHHRHFLLQTGGEVVGHVSAYVNHELRERDQPVGTFGFFECVEDEEVASELLRLAVEWLQAEHGIRQIWAPLNFDIWHGYRLMTRGFDAESFLGEPRNQPYYPAFFERCGFAVRKRWQTVELTDPQSLKELQGYSYDRYREIVQMGYRFRPINPRSSQQLHALGELVVASYHGFLGYTRPRPGVVEELVTAACRLTDPGMSCLVYDPDDNPCGFGIAYPDQSAAVRAMRGRAGIWAHCQFLRHRRRRQDRVVFYLIGISPGEFGKKHGLGRAIFYTTLDKILQSRFTSVLLAIIAEDSPARSMLGPVADAADRQYTLYEMRKP